MADVTKAKVLQFLRDYVDPEDSSVKDHYDGLTSYGDKEDYLKETYDLTNSNGYQEAREGLADAPGSSKDDVMTAIKNEMNDPDILNFTW